MNEQLFDDEDTFLPTDEFELLQLVRKLLETNRDQAVTQLRNIIINHPDQVTTVLVQIKSLFEKGFGKSCYRMLLNLVLELHLDQANKAFCNLLSLDSNKAAILDVMVKRPFTLKFDASIAGNRVNAFFDDIRDLIHLDLLLEVPDLPGIFPLSFDIGRVALKQAKPQKEQVLSLWLRMEEAFDSLMALKSNNESKYLSIKQQPDFMALSMAILQKQDDLDSMERLLISKGMINFVFASVENEKCSPDFFDSLFHNLLKIDQDYELDLFCLFLGSFRVEYTQNALSLGCKKQKMKPKSKFVADLLLELEGIQTELAEIEFEDIDKIFLLPFPLVCRILEQIKTSYFPLSKEIKQRLLELVETTYIKDDFTLLRLQTAVQDIIYPERTDFHAFKHINAPEMDSFSIRSVTVTDFSSLKAKIHYDNLVNKGNLQLEADYLTSNVVEDTPLIELFDDLQPLFAETEDSELNMRGVLALFSYSSSHRMFLNLLLKLLTKLDVDSLEAKVKHIVQTVEEKQTTFQVDLAAKAVVTAVLIGIRWCKAQLKEKSKEYAETSKFYAYFKADSVELVDYRLESLKKRYYFPILRLEEQFEATGPILDSIGLTNTTYFLTDRLVLNKKLKFGLDFLSKADTVYLSNWIGDDYFYSRDHKPSEEDKKHCMNETFAQRKSIYSFKPSKDYGIIINHVVRALKFSSELELVKALTLIRLNKSLTLSFSNNRTVIYEAIKYAKSKIEQPSEEKEIPLNSIKTDRDFEKAMLLRLVLNKANDKANLMKLDEFLYLSHEKWPQLKELKQKVVNESLPRLCEHPVIKKEMVQDLLIRLENNKRDGTLLSNRVSDVEQKLECVIGNVYLSCLPALTRVIKDQIEYLLNSMDLTAKVKNIEIEALEINSLLEVADVIIYKLVEEEFCASSMLGYANFLPLLLFGKGTMKPAEFGTEVLLNLFVPSIFFLADTASAFGVNEPCIPKTKPRNFKKLIEFLQESLEYLVKVEPYRILFALSSWRRDGVFTEWLHVIDPHVDKYPVLKSFNEFFDKIANKMKGKSNGGERFQPNEFSDWLAENQIPVPTTRNLREDKPVLMKKIKRPSELGNGQKSTCYRIGTFISRNHRRRRPNLQIHL